MRSVALVLLVPASAIPGRCGQAARTGTFATTGQWNKAYNILFTYWKNSYVKYCPTSTHLSPLLDYRIGGGLGAHIPNVYRL